MELLNITGQPFSDLTIEEYKFHYYQPFQPGFNYNDEIRIVIQDVDTYTLPCNSYLYIEGRLLTSAGTVPTKLKFVNNALAFVFRELRYELGGNPLSNVRSVGLTSTLKNIVSLNKNESDSMQNAGWFPLVATESDVKKRDKILVNEQGYFNVCIPLHMLSGYFEDFRRIVVNMRQELVLIRSSNDKDSVISEDDSEEPKIDITKIFWAVPHITPSIPEQIRLNNIISKGSLLPIRFRAWDMFEIPSLQTSVSHSLPIITTSKVETPRHILIAFQNKKKGVLTSDMSTFDHCDLKNLKVFLNAERYPYSDLNLDFSKSRYATLYKMFANFRESYYHLKSNEPIYNPNQFKKIAPIVHIDCSRQKEVLQTGSISLRLEFETEKPTNSDISAYCLILHEKEFSYSPLTKIVQQL